MKFTFNLSRIAKLAKSTLWSYPVLYRTLEKPTITSCNNWKDMYKSRHVIAKTVRTCNTKLSPEYYKRLDIKDEGFSDFLAVQNTHCCGGYFVIDELMSIIHDGQSNEKLTEKYYAEKVLQFLQKKRLRTKWKEFLRLPASIQSLETGATLLAQWCQPTNYITLRGICEDLDNIAYEVKALVKSRHPTHSLNSMKDLLSYSSELTEDVFPPANSRQILDCLNHVLYTEKGYYGNEDEYYDVDNSFINKTIENRRGIPITLSVIYSSVTRRLGVICEPVSFPSHFLLRWREHPELEGCEHTFIDAFSKGKRLTVQECRNLVPQLFLVTSVTSEYFDSVHPVKVFERMTRNLITIARQRGRVGGDTMSLLRNVVELFITICPTDTNMVLLFTRISAHLGINLVEVSIQLKSLPVSTMSSQLSAEVVETIKQVEHRMLQIALEDDEKVVKRRNPRSNVDFSVGMIMLHKRYHYTCVIYGWDEKCESSHEWIEQMGVQNLEKKDHQPFYNVLVEDGSNRYAAQENLSFKVDPIKVTHCDVGKYFWRFNGFSYEPNDELLLEYPDDEQYTLDAVQNHYEIDLVNR